MNVKGKEEEKKHTIDQQLERAPLFLFCNFIGQDNCVNASVCFFNFTYDEGITLLFYSVIIQWEVIFKPGNTK